MPKVNDGLTRRERYLQRHDVKQLWYWVIIHEGWYPSGRENKCYLSHGHKLYFDRKTQVYHAEFEGQTVYQDVRLSRLEVRRKRDYIITPRH